MQSLVKYILYYVDVLVEGQWDNRAVYSYYTEFFARALILVTSIGRYVFFMILNGFTLSFVDVIIFLNVRYTFGHLIRKIVAYNNYRRLTRDLNEHFPLAPTHDLGLSFTYLIHSPNSTGRSVSDMP